MAGDAGKEKGAQMSIEKPEPKPEWSTYEEAIKTAMRECSCSRQQAIALIKKFAKERPESCVFKKDVN